MSLINEAGYHGEIYDMFACNNHEKLNPGVAILPEVEARYGERAIEAHILRRVYTNMRLTDFDTDEYTTNLAIAFTQKGIQIGFGQNVKICHNQCMLGAGQYIATFALGKYGAEKMAIEQCLDVVKDWLFNAPQRVNAERQMIEFMKTYQVTIEQIYSVIGMLTATRVACDSRNPNIRASGIYPLNQTQINNVTERMLVKYHENPALTLWDLYNAATEQYKADTMDTVKILPQNMAMVEFLDEQFHFRQIAA